MGKTIGHRYKRICNNEGGIQSPFSLFYRRSIEAWRMMLFGLSRLMKKFGRWEEKEEKGDLLSVEEQMRERFN